MSPQTVTPSSLATSQELYLTPEFQWVLRLLGVKADPSRTLSLKLTLGGPSDPVLIEHSYLAPALSSGEKEQPKPNLCPTGMSRYEAAIAAQREKGRREQKEPTCQPPNA